jgi:hypothetical protein
MNKQTTGSFAEFVSFKSSKKVRMNNTTAPLLNDKSNNDRRPDSLASSLFLRLIGTADSLSPSPRTSSSCSPSSSSGVSVDFSTSSGSMRKYAMVEKTKLAAPKPIPKPKLLLVFALLEVVLLRSAVLKKTLARNARIL